MTYSGHLLTTKFIFVSYTHHMKTIVYNILSVLMRSGVDFHLWCVHGQRVVDVGVLD